MKHDAVETGPDADAYPWLPATGIRGLAAKRPLSLRDLAYERIKHLIVTFALAPNDAVTEAMLSERLGIGRTPVHQAIDRLVSDAMVEVIPRKGLIIKPLSLDEILQTIDGRLLNETAAAGLAADRADGDQIAALRALTTLQARVARAKRADRLLYLHREFHTVLAHAAANKVLAEILRMLHERSLRFWSFCLTLPADRARIHDEHARLLAAIEERRPSQAEAAMREHLEQLRTNVVRQLASRSSA